MVGKCNPLIFSKCYRSATLKIAIFQKISILSGAVAFDAFNGIQKPGSALKIIPCLCIQSLHGLKTTFPRKLHCYCSTTLQT